MAKAKPTKVTKEELAEMREIVQNINGIQMDIGSLEVQKARALSAILEWRGKLIENQNKLIDLELVGHQSLDHLQKTQWILDH